MTKDPLEALENVTNPRSDTFLNALYPGTFESGLEFTDKLTMRVKGEVHLFEELAHLMLYGKSLSHDVLKERTQEWKMKLRRQVWRHTYLLLEETPLETIKMLATCGVAIDMTEHVIACITREVVDRFL